MKKILERIISNFLVFLSAALFLSASVAKNNAGEPLDRSINDYAFIFAEGDDAQNVTKSFSIPWYGPDPDYEPWNGNPINRIFYLHLAR